MKLRIYEAVKRFDHYCHEHHLSSRSKIAQHIVCTFADYAICGKWLR